MECARESIGDDAIFLLLGYSSEAVEGRRLPDRDDANPSWAGITHELVGIGAVVHVQRILLPSTGPYLNPG
jgi:hypothetical protein